MPGGNVNKVPGFFNTVAKFFTINKPEDIFRRQILDKIL